MRSLSISVLSTSTRKTTWFIGPNPYSIQYAQPTAKHTCAFKTVSLRPAILCLDASSPVLSDLRRAGRRSKAGSLVPTDRVRTQVCSGLRYRARRIFRRRHRALTSVPLKLGENARSKTTKRCPERCERGPRCDRPGRRPDPVFLPRDNHRETIASSDAVRGSPWSYAPRIAHNSIPADRGWSPLHFRIRPTRRFGPLASGDS